MKLNPSTRAEYMKLKQSKEKKNAHSNSHCQQYNHHIMYLYRISFEDQKRNELKLT